jgi:hypothetical protein
LKASPTNKNKYGANGQPYLTPSKIGKGSKVAPFKFFDVYAPQTTFKQNERILEVTLYSISIGIRMPKTPYQRF